MSDTIMLKTAIIEQGTSLGKLSSSNEHNMPT